jgi:hypothetical protein
LDFDTVSTVRSAEDFEEASSDAGMADSFTRAQVALQELARRWKDAGVSRAIVIGNDHKESFTDECIAPITVFAGEEVRQVPFTEETLSLMSPGIRRAHSGHTPPYPAIHPGEPELADGLIAHLVAAGFDVARSTVLPAGKYGNGGIPHAFGFPYRRVMKDKVVPHVPLFINTFYAPNIIPVSRCIELGIALGEYLVGAEGDGKTAVVASGGLSHFVIDEELDRRLLAAFASGDIARLHTFADAELASGTAEIRAWITLAAAMLTLGLSFECVDYVPCYRTSAGTGVGAGFGVWV